MKVTDLIQEMIDRHNLINLEARALGEATVGALFISSYCKEGERINLSIDSNGPIKKAMIDANPEGGVRGFVVSNTNNDALAPKQEAIWGEGVISVLRAHLDQSQVPYTGAVPLMSGNLGRDMTHYWAQSEQVPTAVGIFVEVRGDQVIAAGGVLVQALAGAGAKELAYVWGHADDLEFKAAEIVRPETPLINIESAFKNYSFRQIEEKDLVFKCNCSKDRVERALSLVGIHELKDMRDEGKSTEVKCDFCNTGYEFSAQDLQIIIEDLESQIN